MNEKSDITAVALMDADRLESASGGSTGSTQAAGSVSKPLPGITMPTCPYCGSSETTQDVYCEAGTWYKQYKCLKCGSYFGEKKEVVLPDQMPLRGR